MGAVAAGQGSVVLLAGEAGIGKTVLLREFAAQAPVPVLWCMCDSLSTPRPLGPLRDVARELGPEVTAVLREASAQHEIFAAVLDALQFRSCALVVEDLHWADEATWTSCGSWPAAIGTLPLLLVLSYRESGGAAHPLRAVLGDLVGAPDARRLQLTPLSAGRRGRTARRAPARSATRSSSARSSPSRTRRCRRACATPWSPARRPSHRTSAGCWNCCRAQPRG
jgi:predicted ATPase